MKLTAVYKTGCTILASLLLSNLLPSQAAQQKHQDPLMYMGVQCGNEIDTVSTGCYIGTIGTMVTDGTYDYLLSNNHVMARSSAASLGEDIMHTVSTYCDSGALHVGNLTAYVPIQTKRRAQNKVDAAIARVTGNVTVADDGNGNVKQARTETDFTDSFIIFDTPIDPAMNMLVQKSGRTTGYTTSHVSAVGVNVYINYDNGRALFVDQFVVSGAGFSAGGDSGSLISDTSGNPVGLLFAGSSTSTIGNKITDVMAELSAELGATLKFGTSGDVGAAEWPTSGGGSGGDGGSGGGKPNNGKGKPKNGLTVAGAAISHAKAIRDRFESELLDFPGIEGSGISLSEDRKRVVIQVYTSVPSASVRRFIPGRMGGVEVEIIETGVFEAY